MPVVKPIIRLGRRFYARDAAQVAHDLVGSILVRHVGRSIRRARIVETEAYVGPHDLACHASKGRTKRTETMFGPAGHAYVYLIYGMYDMLNIVAAKVGNAQAVLIRAAEPLDGWDIDLSGPGKLARAFDITVAKDNGRDLTKNELYFLSSDSPHIIKTKRIGVEYAKHWQHELLRFIDADSKAVSGPKHLRPPQLLTVSPSPIPAPPRVSRP